MAKGFESLENRTLIEKTGNTACVTFSIPDSSPYFDGHFPGFPILPAVAQVELVVRFCCDYLGTGIAVSRIKRMKFIKLIRPSMKVLLRLELNNDILNFKLVSPEGDDIYSQGTIAVEKA